MKNGAENQPNIDPERLLFQASCSIVAATGPETRKSTPGSTKRRAKSAQSDPKSSPEASRTPPGRPKMVQKATKRNKSLPLGSPGRRESRPRGLRRPIWDGFRTVWPSFPRLPGCMFSISYRIFGHTWRTFFQDLAGHSAQKGNTKHGNQRHSNDTTRRAGGVLPTWLGRPLGGQKRDFERMSRAIWAAKGMTTLSGGGSAVLGPDRRGGVGEG